MSQVQISDSFDNRLGLMHYTVSLSDNPDEPYVDDYFADYNGASTWPRMGMPTDKELHLHVNHFNKNPEFEYQRVDLPAGFNEDVVIKLTRRLRDRATIQGLYSNVFFKGESSFLDLCRLCNGQDIQPLLKQSLKLGSNGRRNFFMTSNTAKAAGLPPFNPDDFPNYYDKVEELLQLYSGYGIYLYSSIFPDNKLFDSWRDNISKQKNHWNRLGDIAARYNNWWGMELTNEPYAHDFNRVDETQFTKINGVICCIGSSGDHGGIPLPDPQWDIVDFHFPRNYPKSVKDGCQSDNPDRLDKHRAVLGGEPLGFGPGRETNARIAKEIAGSSRGTCCGVIYHSTHGGFSQLYDQTEMDCAKAWFKELQGT
jgi:hypothetical protein